jgi:hypothetical protein
MAGNAPGEATRSLMRVALLVDIAVVFFGVLTLRGLGVLSGVSFWWVAAALVAVIVALFGLLKRPAVLWLGSAFHLGLLALFFVDVAVGISALVPGAFWLYAVVKGPSLDGSASTG